MSAKSVRGGPQMLTARLRAVGHQGMVTEAFSAVQRVKIAEAALANCGIDEESSEGGSNAKYRMPQAWARTTDESEA